MATKRARKAGGKVKALKARKLTGSKARSVKGGTVVLFNDGRVAGGYDLKQTKGF